MTPTRLTVPDPVAVDLGKSIPPLKPLPPIAPAPIASIERRAVPAESTRPRRATGRGPDAANPRRPKRTPDQLLAEARQVTAGWPDVKVTAAAAGRWRSPR